MRSHNEGKRINHRSAAAIDNTMSSSSSSSSSIVGRLEDHLAKSLERREERFIITYEPTHKWWKPPLRAWIPDTNREILFLLVLWNVGMTMVARYTNLCGALDHENYDSIFLFCSEDYMLNESHVLNGLGVGLFLLLAFRANNSYQRFWEGRKAWGRIKEVSRDLTRQMVYHIKINSETSRAERQRAIGFLAGFSSTLKLTMRGESNAVPELGGILCFQDILNIEHARVMPQFCLDTLTYYLRKQVDNEALTIQEYCTMNEVCLMVLADQMGTCERIRKTPIPLSYALQLRFFLMVWLLLYPLHLVGHYGWFTPGLSFLVDYAVLGIESMACEIENPFGYHKNCIDLCSFCKEIVADVLDIQRRAEHTDRDQVLEFEKVNAMNQHLLQSRSQSMEQPQQPEVLPLKDQRDIIQESLEFISTMDARKC